MKLIVALGNPGEEYRNTRHNTGFYFLEAYLKEKGFTDWKKKERARYIEKYVQQEKVIFLEPLSEFIRRSRSSFSTLLSDSL